MEMYEKYVGRVFDNRYKIEKVIGIGGMAVVFKATDILMRRVVAVKILKAEISDDGQSVQRFINESKAVAMLSHQNIVNIYDVSVRERIKYIVMEYVEGITLKNYMQHREVLNLREIISYTTQILRALDHAHKKGIVHRDIKPHNIMLLKNGVIKVTDFGIAKLPNVETITMTEKAIGTVYYISPEQVRGEDIDRRSDIYSLGVMMYEMASGQLPFTADTPVSVAMKQVHDKPTTPGEINPKIPVGLEQIIMKAMEKDPRDRYQSAEEMLSDLNKLRENPKIIFREKPVKAKKKTAAEKKKDKPKRKQSRAMFPIILGVTVAFLIVAAVAGITIINEVFLNSSLENYKNITVENFVGATYSNDLSDWFKNSHYYSQPRIVYRHDDTVPEGKIISQEPKAGEVRKVLPGKQKCEITLNISLGVKTITLEDYTVQDYRMAEKKIRALGLKVVVKHVESEVYDIGYVVRTDPAEGAVLQDGDTVTVYVSSGSDPIKTMVPDFVGMTEGQALAMMSEYNLKIGHVFYVKSEKTVGTIISQSSEAWHEVAKFASIDFTVSGGKNYDGDGRELPDTTDIGGDDPDDTRDTEDVNVPDPDDTDDTETTETEKSGGISDWFSGLGGFGRN